MLQHPTFIMVRVLKHSEEEVNELLFKSTARLLSAVVHTWLINVAALLTYILDSYSCSVCGHRVFSAVLQMVSVAVPLTLFLTFVDAVFVGPMPTTDSFPDICRGIVCGLYADH